MAPLLDRLQTQARDAIAAKVAQLARELDERIDREFPPAATGLSAIERDELLAHPDNRKEVEDLLQGLSGVEASARSSAKEALRGRLAGLKGELEEGALGMLDAVAHRNPKAFDGSLAPDKEALLFEKVTEGLQHTLDQLIAGERREIERELDSLKRDRGS